MPYALLVIGAILVDMAATLPLGSLPLALVADGVPPSGVALAIAAGSLTSLAASLPVGGLLDRYGRLAMLRVAAAGLLVSLVLLAFVHGLAANMAVVALRSLATTAYVTGTFAYAGSLVGPQRQVSATATMGMIGNISFAAAPALAVFLWQHGIGREQYLYAALAGVAGMATLWQLPERTAPAGRRSRRILMRSAWLPTVAYLAAGTLMGGVNNSLAVLTFQARGVANGALLFTAVAVTTFALRYPAGRLVDRFGPSVLVVPVALVHLAGAVVTARAHDAGSVAAGGVLLGLAWAAYVPVGLGLLFARSTPGTRGAAMGAYNLSFGAGAAGGAAIASIAAAIPALGFGAAAIAVGVAPLAVAPWVLTVRRGVRARRWSGAATVER